MIDVKERNLTIDLIKLWAIIGVVIIHVCSPVLTEMKVGSFGWTWGLLYGSLFRASVPLFLMASGAIMLDPDKPLSFRKLFTHNIARIIIAMLFWGFCYKIYNLVFEGTFNFSSLWYSVKRLLLFDQEFHFYYLHIILIVYLFLPLSRLISEKADKKLYTYILLIWMLFAIVYPAARMYKPFNLLSGLTGQWAINLTYSSIGYSLLGYFLKKYRLSFIKSLLCFLSGLILTFGATFYLSQKDGILNEAFLQGISPGVFLLAVGLFSLASYVKIKEFLTRSVVYISKASFLIYLSHIFVLYILRQIGITALILQSLISVPLISGGILLVCMGIYFVISKIPVLNKWIV